MAKYQTSAFLDKRPLCTPDSAELCGSAVVVEFPSTALASGDLIELATIPAGLKVLDYKIIFPDVDSGGSPAFAFSIGVENTGGTDLGSEVWATGLTTGQASAIYRPTTAAAFEGDSTVDRKIAIKVTTAAATYAGSGKFGRVVFEIEG
jgi:hypothetical protein